MYVCMCIYIYIYIYIYIHITYTAPIIADRASAARRYTYLYISAYH